jgi:hypothetical protein
MAFAKATDRFPAARLLPELTNPCTGLMASRPVALVWVMLSSTC